VLGIINLRGNIVTVVSTRRLLGLEEQPSQEEARIIIVNRTDDCVGIDVDGVADVIELAPDQIDPAPRVDMAGRPGCAYGVALCGERLTIFIDLDKLLAGVT
jgi:purine-binding chemotaxis protein CheW